MLDDLANNFSALTLLVGRQEGKTSLYFTEARDSEWQWHQLGRMQVTSNVSAFTFQFFCFTIFSCRLRAVD